MFNFGYLSLGHAIRKCMRMSGYFLKPKGARMQKKFGKLCHMLKIFTIVYQDVGKAWWGKGIFPC
jgi:hypothetical protein